MDPQFPQRCIATLGPTPAGPAAAPGPSPHVPQLAAPRPSWCTRLRAQRQARLELRYRCYDEDLGMAAELLVRAAEPDALRVTVAPSWFETVRMLAVEELAHERDQLDDCLGPVAGLFAAAATWGQPHRGWWTAVRVQAGALRAPGAIPAVTLMDPWLDPVRVRLLAPLPRLHRELLVTLAPAFPGSVNELLRAVHAAIADR